MSKRTLDPSEDRSSMVENLTFLAAAAPIIGAVASAPMVGGSLVFLALTDSFLLFFGIW
jgi:hypothetical protein